VTDITRIREYVAEQFLPDVHPDEITRDFDLIDSGAIDSLGLLRLISWLGGHYELSLDDVMVAPEKFRSIQAIEEFVLEVKGQPVSTVHNEGV
jgi:acyl carrier protein